MGFLGIPGMSFSLNRAVGITKAKQKIARTTGIPTTAQGRQLKTGRATQDILSGKNVAKSAGTIVAMTVIDNFLGTKKNRR